MLLNWLKRSAKFDDGLKSNEASFGSTCFCVFSLFFLNLPQEIVDKKQLLFKDANGKIALQQVAQNQGSSEL